MSKKLKFKTYTILERAVENGIRLGLKHAYKHTTLPPYENVVQSVLDDIMLELSEVVDFSES